MGERTPAGQQRTRGLRGAVLRAAPAVALAAVLAGCAAKPAEAEGSARARDPSASNPVFGEPTEPGEAREFAGCYDLSALASIPGSRDVCLDGPDTLLPADSRTGHMVDRLLGGEEVRIRRDEDGRRTVTLRGYEHPDELFLLDPPGASRMPPPSQVAAVRTARSPRRPVPPPPPEDAGTPVASAPPPPPMAAQIEQTLDTLPAGASLQLPVPRAVETPSAITEGTPSFEEMMAGLSRSASRMECGPEGCTCAHPPCVPCPLATSRLAGVDEDTWAVRWIVWYATEGTNSERYLGIRMLTGEERDLIQRAKYRWGFAGGIHVPVGQWDWERGRIPASLVAGAGERLRTLQARGARVQGAEPASAGDVQGALAVVADSSAPAAARVHALRWLARAGRPDEVGGVLRDLAAGDPDESIRGVALDALDDLAARTGGTRRPSARRDPLPDDPR